MAQNGGETLSSYAHDIAEAEARLVAKRDAMLAGSASLQSMDTSGSVTESVMKVLKAKMGEVTATMQQTRQVLDTTAQLLQGDPRQDAALQSRRAALLVIDVQNDFISGSLGLRFCPAQQEGGDVIPVINRLRAYPWDLVVLSKDWHPQDHVSFIENVQQAPIAGDSPVQAGDAKPMDVVRFTDGSEQTMWPAHCIQGSEGSDLAKELVQLESDVIVLKGTHQSVDSYSAFFDNNKKAQTELAAVLQRHGITDIYCCGLAYDVCVAFTALDGMELGMKTFVIEDACRGVTNEGIAAQKAAMQTAGIRIVQSRDVLKYFDAQTG